MKSAASAGMIVLSVSGMAAAREPVFRVTLDPRVCGEAASGRLVIAVVLADGKDGAGADPNDAPFWENPRPMFGADVTSLLPGDAAVVEGDPDWSTVRLGQLPPGEYRGAARLITTRRTSDWRRDPGNLYSDAVTFRVSADAGSTVEMSLSHRTEGRAWPAGAEAHGAELFEVRSALLSAFHGREVMLRAGVLPPAGPDPARKYAAVYEVPGFGGDHFGVIRDGAAREAGRAGPLDGEVYRIELDPESPNGHTLFADSANNGPCGRALVEELIPALEKKYALDARAEARLLRGHSSGGWSTLWLALKYPGTFGAAWPSSPDPVDFRRFQVVDIYSGKNMYVEEGRVAGVPGGGGAGGVPRDSPNPPGALFAPEAPESGSLIASLRRGDKPVMSVRDEARGEDVLGSDNTSGQQWDSWFAVFGPRDGEGHPGALFDPATGVIDHTVAERYRGYDIGALLRSDPARYGGLLRGRVRLLVGDQDSFFLNEAVSLLKADLDRLFPAKDGDKGYIKILPGYDHGSVLRDAAARAIPSEMLAHLKEHGLAGAGE